MAGYNRTKKRIRKAILEMLQTVEPDRITATALAEKAEVSRATLYRYYNSVDEVLKTLEDEFMEGVQEHCEKISGFNEQSGFDRFPLVFSATYFTMVFINIAVKKH